MERKIILRVSDLEFENNNESVKQCLNETELLLNNKGYFFDGILLSIKTKIAYVWKYVQPKKQKPVRA
jgi:hypothetical protein